MEKVKISHNISHNIAVDLVEVDRFKNWYNYKISTLKKVFTDREIEYCLSNKLKSTERFAVRFAAKEALYKLLSCYFISNLKLLNFIKLIEVTANPYPNYLIDKKIINNLSIKNFTISLSLTHAKNTACATAFILFSN